MAFDENGFDGANPEALEEWRPIFPSDILSTTAFTDPNGALSGPIVHQGDGVWRFPMVQNGSVSIDGLGEGAAIRLNWPGNWLGTGLFGLMFRATPQTDAAFVSALIGVGITDRGGDATNASARVVGGLLDATGLGAFSAGSLGRTFGGGNTSSLNRAQTARMLGVWAPLGPVGDESSSGFRDARLGSFSPFMRDSGTNVQSGSAASDNSGPTDGLFAELFAGADANGAGAGDWDVLWEWRRYRLFLDGDLA